MSNPTILQEADALINGQRAKDYGDAAENCSRIARLWSEALRCNVSAEQVALCIIQLKVERATTSPGHRDSWLDIAGYVGCWERINQGKKGEL